MCTFAFSNTKETGPLLHSLSIQYLFLKNRSINLVINRNGSISLHIVSTLKLRVCHDIIRLKPLKDQFK